MHTHTYVHTQRPTHIHTHKQYSLLHTYFGPVSGCDLNEHVPGVQVDLGMVTYIDVQQNRVSTKVLYITEEQCRLRSSKY